MIKIPTPQASLTKLIKSTLNELAKKYPDVKFIHSIISPDWSTSKLSNIFGEDVLKRIQFEQNLGIDDVVFIAYGDKTRTVSAVIYMHI